MISEDSLEKECLGWFRNLGWTWVHGPVLAPDGNEPERHTFGDVVLERRLRDAIARLNPGLDSVAKDEVVRKLRHPPHVALAQNNRTIHDYLVSGVPLDIVRDDGGRGVNARLVDFENPTNNDWLVVNQFAVIEGKRNRRPDVVAFLNGLPIAVLELKNAASEQNDIWSAFNQLQTYKAEIPSLFAYNALLVISDGLNARAGSLTADRERFMPWRTVEGEELAPTSLLQLQVLVEGVFEPARLLDYLRHFIAFEESRSGVVKKIAGYHQFHAVRRALKETVKAIQHGGDRKAGVVWHTQGSGKSLTMTFYAGKIIRHPALENPTLVVLTDRNDLDDQLFGTFSANRDLLRQAPEQASDRDDLREKLNKRAAGGVIFTTIQKFLPDERGEKHPLLSERRNIVVIADEAHRSQYGFKARLDKKTGKYVYGFAQYVREALPQASFIGFTGTPIDLEDKDTRRIFGDYISVYDIQQAVEDNATVKIYYESRLAKLALNEKERPHLDAEIEEITEGDEEARRQKIKTKWASLEALVGSDTRIELVAQDLVKHFDARLETIDGKAMVVCMSRRICVAMYNAIVKLRPDWHHPDDEKGSIKVVMSGSASDDESFRPHIRSKRATERVAERFKEAEDSLKIVIVRDMWLTGFDVPCLHTMYLDKPMYGHNFMQAIARVNRVFKDKPGGLVVDYLGLADALRKAMATYAANNGRGRMALELDDALAMLREKLEVCRDMLSGFDYSKWRTQPLLLLPGAQEHLLTQDNGKKRWLDAVTVLSRALALCGTHDDAMAVREEVAFYQAVRAALVKSETTGIAKREYDVEHAIHQIVSKAIISDKVIDIFSAAGLKKPDISILSDEFLAEVQGMPQKNLAVELLQKLLHDEISSRSRKYLVQAKSFAAMLEEAIKKYQSRIIQAAQVIEELIQLAKDMKAASDRGEQLNLNEDEIAFYDALEVNDSAVKVLGDDTLRTIARELVEAIKRNTSIDWTERAAIQAKLRVIVKRILRKYGYPPDKQETATQTVLMQARLLANEWVNGNT